MKNLLYILKTCLFSAIIIVSFLVYSSNLKAKTASVEILRIQDNVFGECYRIRNNEVSVLVSPGTGRIVFYGFNGGENQLWTNPQAIAYKEQIGNWINWGGDKVWIWPQGDWHQVVGRAWPPQDHVDGKPWQVDVVKNDGIAYLELVSGPIPRYDIKIIRSVKLTEKGTELTVETRFVPLMKADPLNYRFAVWTVTQVPAGNGVYARVIPDVKEPIIHPMAGSKPWPSLTKLGHGRIIFLPRNGGDWAKGGLDADLLAVYNDKVLLVQKVIPSKHYSTGKFRSGERAQICSSPDNSPCYPEKLSPYFELEYTSPLASSANEASHHLTVQWSLHKFADSKVVEKDIVSFLEYF